MKYELFRKLRSYDAACCKERREMKTFAGTILQNNGIKKSKKFACLGDEKSLFPLHFDGYEDSVSNQNKKWDKKSDSGRL